MSKILDKSLTIVIPCFNEGESINSLIEKCKKSLDNRSDIEIVLVNNGSTDSTSEIFKEINQNKKIFPYIIIKNIKKNLGYGNGIIEGLNNEKTNRYDCCGICSYRGSSTSFLFKVSNNSKRLFWG